MKRSDRPTIVTIARMEERYKGHDVLLRALPLVRARVPGIRWLAIGDGALKMRLQALATALDVDDCACFAGPVPDAERDRWLERGHVFAMPSRLPSGATGGEGFGIALLEAGARGLPVVAGNVAGALDAVVDGVTGVLVDPTDHVMVADAITGVLLDPGRAAALGRSGAEHAKRFAWPLVGAKLSTLLREVVGGV
jgi:phosphatidylinositol alpha-1,6-mannosyltransferase